MERGWDVYRVGAKLGVVRDLIRLDSENGRRAFQRHERALSCVAVRSRGRVDQPLETGSDAYLIVRVLLGLLQRGDAPLVSPFVEEALLRQSGIAFASLHEHDESAQDVGFVWVIDEDEADSLRYRLRTAQFATDPRVTPDWGNRYGSNAERTFVEQQMMGLLGRALPLLEPQRLITSMLDPEMTDVNRFVDQRVDFALETHSDPPLKVVFEIDGHQHQVEAQQLLDQMRDYALMESGWIVERISLEAGGSTLSPRLRARIEADPWLKALKNWPNVTLSDLGTAGTLILGTHSIVRVQLAILVAILNGTLPRETTSPWKIGVIERDAACARIALVDLLRQFEALSTLYGVPTIPSVELLVVGDRPDREETLLDHPHLRHHYVDLATLRERDAIDLLIDVSVLARPADRFGDSFVVGQLGLLGTPVLEVRTANYQSAEKLWSWCAPRPVSPDHATDDLLAYFLQLVFRKRTFRPQQANVIRRALQRKNLIGLLPTGSGKSVTFQLPTLLSPGAAIVVAPLRALIDDQADNLHRAGIGRLAAIHGGMDRREKKRRLRSISREGPRFIYVSPERLQMQDFREELRGSAIAQAVTYVIVDEAHCVSEWGHDFRPAYLNVGRVARQLCTTQNGEPPILALTGTASDTVLLDIARELQMDRSEDGLIISAMSFDRPELRFLPLEIPNSIKSSALRTAMEMVAGLLQVPVDLLVNESSRGGLVFCRHVNGDYGVAGVSRALRESLVADDSRIRIYAGSQPANQAGAPDDWNEYKRHTQRAFKDDKFPLLVSTSSFGMGIDKANIRYTIHFGIPGSIEALAQEAGRAGRDRQLAACVVIYSGQKHYDYLSPDMDTETARTMVEAVGRRSDSRDDITRSMYLHFQAYPGISADLDTTRQVLARILVEWNRWATDVNTAAQVVLQRSGVDSSSEHAIYRLSVLGIVRDYTVDYARNVFMVDAVRIDPMDALTRLGDYVYRYEGVGRASDIVSRAQSRDRLEMLSPYDHIIQTMCEFIYETIERSRRRSLQNLVAELSASELDGVELRERISSYLAKNSFTSAIANIALEKHHDPEGWWAQLKSIRSPDEAAMMLIAIRRQLESSPTHPGLLLMEALSAMLGEATLPDDIAASLIAGLANYEATREPNDMLEQELLQMIVLQMVRASPQRFDQVIGATLRRSFRADLARAAYPHVKSPDVQRMCAIPWLQSMTTGARWLRESTLGVQ